MVFSNMAASLAPALLSTLLLLQSASAQIPLPTGTNQTLGSFTLEATIWQLEQIPVCWEPLPASNRTYSGEKAWVQEAVAATWGAHGVVSFGGWSTCGDSDGGIRIQVSDVGPHTKGLGNQLDGMQNGMVLNFEFLNWSTGCQLEREYCIRTIAVHEFGHALGLAHEQNRLDTPRDTCTKDPQGTSGDFQIGPWDEHSVMNYCNKEWNGSGLLSQGDVAALVLLYGRPVALHVYHPDCVSASQSGSPSCIAAMHRYCYMNGKGSAAYPQEVGDRDIAFVCANATWYGDVAFGDAIPNCAAAGYGTQTPECYSSAHRYCDSIGHPGIGMVQEIGPGGDVAGIACVPVAWSQTVKISELLKKHPGCSSPALAQTPGCRAAVHRYCTDNNFGLGGAITELGADEVAVGCISGANGVYVSDLV